jgi:hypothetical protein
MAVTPAEQTILEEFAKSKPAVEAQARVRWASSESYQSRQVSKYRQLHHYYNPENQDHWPQDVALRPGKIHTTSNLCKVAVDVDSRIQSLPPRITLPVATLSGDDRLRAEAAEAIQMEWLELSGFPVWLHNVCQIKSIYGKGILQPRWDTELKRGDVTVIENPGNLRLGWGSSDYSKIDWGIYETSMSFQQVKLRWPHVTIEKQRNGMPPHLKIDGGDHADPLSQKDDNFYKPFFREHSDYERTQVQVWDYWYKTDDGTVNNVTLINAQIVEGPTPHEELPDVPYIVIEQDHEPGSPEGISTIEPIINLQQEFNRLLSHGLQHIADNVDPAWYIKGPGADTVDSGIVPKAGEVTGLGEAEPGAWPTSVNTFPIQEMLGELWNEFHRLTGLPEILFGQTPGADTSGRAIAIQVEAAANRLDPRRRRLYVGIKELLIFWTIMAERVNPQVEIGPEINEETGEATGTQKTAGVGDMLKGFVNWKIVAPEITPRDNADVARLEIEKQGALLSSKRASMDQIGVESPEAEIKIIEQEQSNLKINPAAVQQQVAVLTIAAQLEQLRMQNQQLAAEVAQLGQQQQAPGSVLAPNQNANVAAQAEAAGQQQGLAPRQAEDQNQTATGPGSPAAPGAPPPGGAEGPATLQALSRQGGENLNQIAFSSGGGQ